MSHGLPVAPGREIATGKATAAKRVVVTFQPPIGCIFEPRRSVRPDTPAPRIGAFSALEQLQLEERVAIQMVAAIVVSAVISGIVAAFAAWILGYGLAVILLAWWLAGTLALILTAFLHVIFGVIARWWWARSVVFRFRVVLLQSAGIAAVGASILGFAVVGMLHPAVAILALALLISAPIWLTLAMDSILGKPEQRGIEDYL